MPRWSTGPPAKESSYALRILRTPAATPLDAIITSVEITGTPTHFLQNRTVPCEDTEDCPHCQAGHSRRWHGYLACILVDGLEHVLFEFTKIMAQPFQTYSELYTTLRGCKFQARRPSKRHNGRVVIKCKRTDPAELRLPEPPNVKKILCHIWNIQYDPAGDSQDPAGGGRLLGTAPGNGDGRIRSPQKQPK